MLSLRFVKYFNSSVPRASCVVPKITMSTLATEKTVETGSLKREASKLASELEDGITAKKPLLETEQKTVDRVKRKKVAMMIAYLGQGYQGLQRNPGTKTIEEEIMVALHKAGYITEIIFNQPQQIHFQRAARTDKGVSALRQVLSLKLPDYSKPEEINKHLPEQIRTLSIKRATKSFNSKGNCDARTYSYMTPTFAFSPHGSNVTEDHRISSETQEQLSQVLKLFEGTHNFHNFTSKRLAADPSVNRYIMSFVSGPPFVIDDIEFVTLKVKGQSFMLHQIRKMVGLTIAIIRGLTNTDTLIRSWERDRLDIPIAPGLGLLLEEVHYDRYNQRYGLDGVHQPIEWSDCNQEVEEFRQKFIIPAVVKGEKEEKSMLTWLDSLNLHSFDVRTEHIHSDLDKELEKNQGLLAPPNYVDVLIPAAHVTEPAR